MLGVCYYPEQWPEQLWRSDAQQMKALGLSVVRIGEFAWSRFEPEPSRYEFAWFDRVIEILVEEGLKVVIGTPTATPPKWLVDRYPEILPVCPDTGAVRGFGSRRHYDFSSQRYRQEALRITRVLAERYGHHEGVIGWQTDNELCCHDTTLSASPVALEAFRQWCQRRYQTIEQLNESWGNVFWSMEYRSFAEIELPIAAVTETNPAHRLAYRRFSSDQVIDFHRDMVAVIRQHAPDRFITHNFIPMKDTGVDCFSLAEELDFASYDNYPLGRTDFLFADAPNEAVIPYMRTGHPDYASYYHDQIRGLSQKDFWIMEQQPGPVNWAPSNPRPAPGMVRLWSWEAFAHGAECVCFFRWRQAPFAQEQMHAGLLRPDQTRSESWPEIETLAAELQEIVLPPAKPHQAAVAMVVDVQGQWVSEIEVQGQSYRFNDVQLQYYSAVRQLGVDVDVVSASSTFEGYRLVLVPCLPIIDDGFIQRCQKSSAEFVFAPRTAAKTSEFALPENLPPGALQSLVPIKVLSVETLREGISEPVEWLANSLDNVDEKTFESQRWCESIELLDEKMQILANYHNGESAIVRHQNYTYLATLTSDQLLKHLLKELCQKLAIEVFVLPPDVRVRRRGDLYFAFNYSHACQTLPVAANTKFLLGARNLLPRDVAIWSESQ